MEQIAFIFGDIFLYWDSIVLALASGVAICVFLAFYLRDGSNTAAAAAVPLALVLSLLIGRVLHWYFRPNSYNGFMDAIANITSGGYALLGCFVACGATAGLLWLLKLVKHPLRMLDAMSMGGCAGIAVGRLACFFNSSDRGQLLTSLKSLPFAYPVSNAVTGAAEYRLATFVIQAMVTALIFVILLAFFFLSRRRQGDVTYVFLLLYCFSQTVLDSTRYDSLFLRSNGFISAVQLISAITLVVISVLFSVRMVKRSRFHWWYTLMWTAMLAALGGAGYMEYYVQRHGDKALFSYTIMTLCLSLIVVLSLYAYFSARKNSAGYTGTRSKKQFSPLV